MQKLFLWIGLSSFALALQGQTLVFPAEQLPRFIADSSFLTTSLFPSTSASYTASPHLLPAYARENPSGYSYLCRMELKLEDQLPVGLWIKLPAPGLPTQQIALPPTIDRARLQVKLLRF